MRPTTTLDAFLQKNGTALTYTITSGYIERYLWQEDNDYCVVDHRRTVVFKTLDEALEELMRE